ncbi:MAG: hypothetical protein ACOX36_06935 [Saccharofermentanales bacterium]|jgi:hypothetical protein
MVAQDSGMLGDALASLYLYIIKKIEQLGKRRDELSLIASVTSKIL